jgi:nucleoside-diphosphate-sugar epimerase
MKENESDIRGMKIVLIGGAGFIGHNLALELKTQGADVFIIDSLFVNNLLAFSSAEVQTDNRELYLLFINQRLELLKQAQIPLYIQDARNYDALSKVLHTIGPDIIIHLAAIAHAGKSNKDPRSTFDHSLRTLENALDCARYENIKQFIYFSSSMVYGNFLTEEVTEEEPLNPIGIYGALKLAGEKMVIAYNQVFNLPYTIVRPSALYGPRCVSRRVGQIFIENLMKGTPLRVDGDGSERLDFTYIDDLVHGVIQTIRSPAAKGQIFNVTYGKSRSVMDLIGILRNHFPEVSVQSVERDNLMPFRGTLNIDKAKQMIDYHPQNPVEIGFPKYIAWYKNLDPTGKIWKEL